MLLWTEEGPGLKVSTATMEQKKLQSVEAEKLS